MTKSLKLHNIFTDLSEYSNSPKNLKLAKLRNISEKFTNSLKTYKLRTLSITLGA